MPSTTSNLFTNSANQPNQITHQPIQNIYVNTHAPPPGFAPIQAGFGQNYYDNFEGQPAYSTYTNPAYQAQGSQIPKPAGFSFHVGQMTVNAPFYGQGTPAYQYQVQQMRTHDNFVSHQQAPPHGQVQRNHVVQDIPVAQPEYRPIIPETQSRIQWTPELHEAFTRAVEELGGCFSKKTDLSCALMHIDWLFTYMFGLYIRTSHIDIFLFVSCKVVDRFCFAKTFNGKIFHYFWISLL